MNENVCHSCGQIIQKPHKETLTKIKCEMLKGAANLVISTGVNQFKMRDIGDFATEPTKYNNFQKLRYHGLVTQVKQNGVKLRNDWLITRNGWAFLRGELKLPKYVLVKNNHVEASGRSDVLVGLLDVLKGGEYMETRFEYFDDNGNMVGLRPNVPQDSPQLSLAGV